MDSDNEINIEITIIPSEKKIYISEENSSGCEQSYKNKNDMKKIFSNYLSTYHYKKIQYRKEMQI